MTTPIILTVAERAPSGRRGVGLGVGAFVLSIFTGFWSIILWAVSIGATAPGSGRAIAVVFFALCAIIGFLFFALTAIAATLSFRRNVRRVWAFLACVIATGALTAGVVLAVSVATA